MKKILFCLALACASAGAATPPVAPRPSDANADAQNAVDEQAVMTYALSVSAPALIDVCKTVNPYGAARFEHSLTRWQAVNQQLIEFSRERTEEVARRENKSAQAEFAAQRDRLVAELLEMKPEQAMKRCEHLADMLDEGLK